eukprot:CAMPEP_0170562004 /NCGR_PEP_ID=MMETSP0211-20121228/58180_1 /TAXON_ID=311385 /ORGANISM="Pseudokeronopsis sp., Strain OXSARD2" /LENGTH=60 /DNA_ID=CAMNT_0010878301 /DNA_START=852 /DNA_END=1034 /DNA_ORIENTATION=-
MPIDLDLHLVDLLALPINIKVTVGLNIRYPPLPGLIVFRQLTYHLVDDLRIHLESLAAYS